MIEKRSEAVEKKTRVLLLAAVVPVQLACAVCAALIWHGFLLGNRELSALPLGLGALLVGADTLLVCGMKSVPAKAKVPKAPRAPKAPKEKRRQSRPAAASSPVIAPYPASAPPGDSHTELLRPQDRFASPENETVFLANERAITLTYSNGGQPVRVSVSLFPAIIGRSPNNASVVIDDPSVSRRHVLIDDEEGSFYAANLSETNGALLEGETITDRTLLKHGDILKLGRVEVTVNME
jgi:hypothetical protein